MSRLYQLPLLLTLTDDPSISNLRLLRKKMLADLELSGGQTLKVGKRLCTKDDLIKMFDAATDGNDGLGNAKIVQRHSWLLRFMTEAKLPNPAAVKADDPELHSEAFTRFARPYLEEAYWRSWRRCFESVDDTGAYAWIRIAPTPVFAEARRQVLHRVRDYLESDLRATTSSTPQEQALGIQGGFHTKNLPAYCNKIVRVLCELPPDFQDLKTDYARAWANAIIKQAYQHTSAVFLDSLDTLHELLPADSPLHRQIRESQRQARRQISPVMERQHQATARRDEASSGKSILWLILWLIIISMRFCGGF